MDTLKEWIDATLREHDQQEREEAERREKEAEEKAEAQRKKVIACLCDWGVPLPMDEENWTEEGYLRYKSLIINFFQTGPETTGLNTVESGDNNFHHSAKGLAFFLRDYLPRRANQEERSAREKEEESAFADG